MRCVAAATVCVKLICFESVSVLDQNMLPFAEKDARHDLITLLTTFATLSHLFEYIGRYLPYIVTSKVTLVLFLLSFFSVFLPFPPFLKGTPYVL